MKKHSHILAFVALSVIIAATGFYLAGKYILPQIVGSTEPIQAAPKAVTGESVLNKQAPSFALSDLSGDRITLAQSYGVPVVVTFWATWDKDSADQVKILDDYATNDLEQAQLVHTIAIDSQEDQSIVTSFMKRGGYNVRTLVDPFGQTSSQYNIKSLPTTYFISRDGVVRDIYVGVLSEHGFVEKVDNLLKQSTLQ